MQGRRGEELGPRTLLVSVQIRIRIALEASFSRHEGQKHPQYPSNPGIIGIPGHGSAAERTTFWS